MGWLVAPSEWRACGRAGAPPSLSPSPWMNSCLSAVAGDQFLLIHEIAFLVHSPHRRHLDSFCGRGHTFCSTQSGKSGAAPPPHRFMSTGGCRLSRWLIVRRTRERRLPSHPQHFNRQKICRQKARGTTRGLHLRSGQLIISNYHLSGNSALYHMLAWTRCYKWSKHIQSKG